MHRNCDRIEKIVTNVARRLLSGDGQYASPVRFGAYQQHNAEFRPSARHRAQWRDRGHFFREPRCAGSASTGELKALFMTRLRITPGVTKGPAPCHRRENLRHSAPTTNFTFAPTNPPRALLFRLLPNSSRVRLSRATGQPAAWLSLAGHCHWNASVDNVEHLAHGGRAAREQEP
jgi:hypothetical protein